MCAIREQWKVCGKRDCFILYGWRVMSFSRDYQLETERKNNLVIKQLQKQGDLPEDAPWEYISPQTGMPLLEKYQCTIPGCERLTFKIVFSVQKDYLTTVLCQFLFGTNDTHNRCHSCAKRAGINRQMY
jgi:hypothetical protein